MASRRERGRRGRSGGENGMKGCLGWKTRLRYIELSGSKSEAEQWRMRTSGQKLSQRANGEGGGRNVNVRREQVYTAR